MSDAKKVAVVTGASKGIGAAVADTLTADGFVVYRASRTAKGALGLEMDVACEDSVQHGFAKVMEEQGRLDLLVNNAGVASATSIVDCSLEEWNHILAVNLSGAFLCSKEAIKTFLNAGNGTIINVASVAGRQYSLTASEAYTASKYGLIGLTRQLAHRHASHGIRVNAVCPSQTLTEMLIEGTTKEKRTELAAANPMKRLANPEEVAEAVRFLASDACPYMNGSILDINGGLV